MSRAARKGKAQLERELAAIMAQGAHKRAAGATAINPKGWKAARAGTHWEVKALVPNERGLASGMRDRQGFVAQCGHEHATRDEAIMCPWEPTPWPEVCDLVVVQIRDKDEHSKPEQGRMF